jgi:hypothetical protein
MIYVLLMIFTLLGVLALFGALLYFLSKIITVLDQVGGLPDSYLAKLRLGLRAIETETGHLPTQVTTLNTGLQAVAGGLGAVDVALVATATAAIAQEK